MRVGLLGGTFSPTHHGHVICAQEARIQLDLDEVRLMPVAEPPHRTLDKSEHPDDDTRVAMCRLAVLGQPGLAVDTSEIERGGKSYTVETLAELAERQPDDNFTLIVGADQAMAFGNWRDPEKIAEIAEIAVATRVDHSGTEAEAEVARATGAAEPRSIEMPRVDISSSLIRERVYGGDTVSHLVPAGVSELIEEQGLYR